MSKYKGYNIKHPLYQSWKTMKRKCDNANAKDYCGTTYPTEWKSYGNFYDWAINHWKEKTFLGRINLNEGFSPENCVFRTKKEINSLTDNNSKKAKQTCLEKYGVDHYNKTPEYLDKVKKTSLRKHGVEHHSQSEKVKEKLKKTNLAKYGVECVLANKDIREKIKETNIKVRGVEYPSKDPIVIEKIKETMKKNGKMYVHNNMDSDKLAKKLGVSRSCMNARIRKYGYELAVSIEKKESIIEKLMSTELDNLNIVYEKQKKVEDKWADFLINNKIIIEVDGLYWHSDKVNHDKQYHRKKRQLYLKHNYFPLFFRENEIYNKLPICVSILKNKLNLNTKIFARKCEIVELNKNEREKFFTNNHLMGKGSGNCLALLYNEEVVCSVQYVNKENHIEISRFCTKLNTTVIGGYTRLISKLPNKEVRTFIDLRYGSGQYLINLGFEKKNEDLSFVWTDYKNTYHRLNYKSNSGYDYGLVKLWDCGQALWIKKAGQ